MIMRSAWIIFLLVLAMTAGAGASDSGPDSLDDQIAALEKENVTLKKTIRLEALKKENASLRSQLGLASAAERPKAIQSADRQSSTVSASEALPHAPTKASRPSWPAIAKDKAEPLYTPSALVPVASWTGFYAGVNAGGGWGTKQIDNRVTNTGCFVAVLFNCRFFTGFRDDILPGQFATHPHGFIGGGQIGYNYLFAPNWVAGLETDFQGANLRGKADANNAIPVLGAPGSFYAAGASGSQEIDWFGTLRARLGWLPVNSLLVYATGGLAYGHTHGNASFSAASGPAPVNFAFNGASALSQSDTRVGWTTGVGGEWMFAPQWSVKVEYLYYNLGTVTKNQTLPQYETSVCAPFPFCATTTDIQSAVHYRGNIARAGVNFKLD